MKYPKNRSYALIQLAEYVCPQVNLHKGRIWNYWFIQPSEKPIKLSKGEIPELLKNANLEKLGTF